MNIFVYGTLKRNQPLHYALQAQRFVGEARTLSHFQLFSLGDYPGMIHARSPESARQIEGEVWEVDSTCLAALDVIEAVEEGEYERVRISLHPPFDGVEVEGYLYLGDVSGLDEVGNRW